LRACSPPRDRKADKLSSLNDDTVSRIGALLMRNRWETGQWPGEINLQFAGGEPLERALCIATRAATGYSRDVGRSLKLLSTVDMETILYDFTEGFPKSQAGKKPGTAALSVNNSGRNGGTSAWIDARTWRIDSSGSRARPPLMTLILFSRAESIFTLRTADCKSRGIRSLKRINRKRIRARWTN